jgi:hypothetical protein
VDPYRVSDPEAELPGQSLLDCRFVGRGALEQKEDEQRTHAEF